MHKRLLLGLVLFAVGALLSLHAQTPAAPAAPVAPAAMPAGQILAAKVIGNVTMTVGGGVPVKLNNTDPVSQHATIITEKESSVVLVFSNGATTQLGETTQLVIDEFLQDPFSAAIKVADLNEEPTTSRTKLRLTHGELVGNVKHLKHDQGSAFTVETPVGAAGIRGTTFRIVFRPSGTGLAFFSLSTVEGNVAFQQPGAGGGNGAGAGTGTTPGTGTPADAGTGTGTAAGTGTGTGTTPGAGGTTGGASTTTGAGGTTGGSGGAGGVAVTGGQEVVLTVNVTVNPTTNVMTVSTPVVVTNTTNISAATMAAVSQQAVAIVTTAAAVTFTPTPPATPPAGASGSNSSSTNTPSGDSSSSGTGTGGNTGTGTNTNTGTGTNTNTNTGSNLGNTPPAATSSAPHLTSGDGKSD